MFGKSKLGNIVYYVNNLKRTEAFYRDTIGLDIQPIPGEGDADVGLMASTSNDVSLIFFQLDSKPGNSPIIVFEIAEGGIDDVVAALVSKGVTIVTPVSHAPGGLSADFADPDGHVISVYQADGLPRSKK
jgi:glyoxylase I family protein